MGVASTELKSLCLPQINSMGATPNLPTKEVRASWVKVGNTYLGPTHSSLERRSKRNNDQTTILVGIKRKRGNDPLEKIPHKRNLNYPERFLPLFPWQVVMVPRGGETSPTRWLFCPNFFVGRTKVLILHPLICPTYYFADANINLSFYNF